MSQRSRAIGAFVLVTLIWGSTWLVIKDQLGTVPSVWSVTWRFSLATLGMFALALWRRERLWLDPPALRLAAVIGLFQFFANFQMVYRSEHYLTSGLVAVIFALLLVPNALAARVFLGIAVTRRFLAGSVIALAGIGLLMFHEYRSAVQGGSVLIGIALALCATLCASVANVLQATERARQQPVVVLIAWAMLFGALADFGFAWLTSGPPTVEWSGHYLGGIAYLALIGSVVTFPLYFALIRDLGPGPAAYTGVAIPVVAMALSTLFEAYRWSALAGGGAALAMLGLLIALSGRK